MEYISEGLRALAVPVDSLNLDPANARLHSERNVDAVKASLARFGQRQPLVVQRQGMIVRAGNARLVAAKALGWTHVAVLVVDEGNVEATAYAIADNRTAELAEWDDQALARLIAEIDDDELRDATGFTDEELEEIVNGSEPPEIVEDEAPPVPEVATSKPGQLWALGDHRVLCGDATDDAAWDSVTAAKPVGAVVSDPPYGIGFEYESHDDGREKWFDLMNAVVPKIRAWGQFAVIPCCGIDRLGWWYQAHSPEWIIVWYKGSPGHRSHVGFNDWEAHLVWGKPPSQIHDYFQTECGFKDAEGHPCPKPVKWASWLCERAVDPGDVILDPFLGSGTTLIACEQLNRRCYGIEIEPRYVDVIIKRWENFTGRKAELIEGDIHAGRQAQQADA